MKAIFKGIDCGRLKRGDEVEIEILDKLKVKVNGDKFCYTFTYYEDDAIEKNWSILDD